MTLAVEQGVVINNMHYQYVDKETGYRNNEDYWSTKGYFLMYYQVLRTGIKSKPWNC